MNIRILILWYGITLLFLIQREDAVHRCISRQYLIRLTAVALAWRMAADLSLPPTGIGIVYGGAILLEPWIACTPFLLIYLFSRGRWIGAGDVRFMWVMGLWFGTEASMYIIMTGIPLAVLMSGVRDADFSWLRVTRKRLASQIPLGPGLCISAAGILLLQWSRSVVQL